MQNVSTLAVTKTPSPLTTNYIFFADDSTTPSVNGTPVTRGQGRGSLRGGRNGRGHGSYQRPMTHHTRGRGTRGVGTMRRRGRRYRQRRANNNERSSQRDLIRVFEYIVRFVDSFLLFPYHTSLYIMFGLF